jgi:hypothetical protein
MQLDALSDHGDAQQATGSAAPGGRISVSARAVRGKGIDRRPQAVVVQAAGRAAA